MSSNLIARSKFFKDFTLGFSGVRQIASFAKPLGSQHCRRYETWERVKKTDRCVPIDNHQLGCRATRRASNQTRDRAVSVLFAELVMPLMDTVFLATASVLAKTAPELSISRSDTGVLGVFHKCSRFAND